MKTLLATIVAALFITLFFVGGVYCLYTQVADPALFIVALGSAWRFRYGCYCLLFSVKDGKGLFLFIFMTGVC